MTPGYVIRKDYYHGADACWVYLELRPFDGAWFWLAGDMQHATVIARSVAETMAAQLQREEPDVTVRALADYYRRHTEIVDLPAAFRSAA